MCNISFIVFSIYNMCIGGGVMSKLKIPFVSKKCVNHSNKGQFGYTNRQPTIMLGGGHGQDNINYLNSKNIAHDILVEYNNGVRQGNISIHFKRHKRHRGKQMWFPKGWTEKDIKAAGEHVMSLKKNQKRENFKPHTGTYKGVRVGTYTSNGRVTTIFPCYEQKGGIKK